MERNNKYVGVDEKYIPEEEKNLNNSSDNEFRDDVNNLYKKAKEVMSDQDNQKKAFKIFKGIGIGYITYIILGVIFAIAIIITVIVMFFKISNKSNDIKDDAKDFFNKVQDVQDNIKDNAQNNSDKMQDVINNESEKITISAFNADLEMYAGTKLGRQVSILIDNVVMKIKKNKDKPIIVSFKDTSSSDAETIISLKKEINDNDKYEVVLDYDEKGYVNKIQITSY